MKDIAKVWTFPSSSNPSKSYQTIRYADGSTSCNCPGWTRKIQPNGTRRCRHTMDIDMNLADAHAISYKDYLKTESKFNKFSFIANQPELSHLKE